ncbi:MAG: glutamate racemase [Candidatus Falkowbacteria bacterium]|nr:glutamate racemase [Candidatus Falkowbacteria bacterium]
MKIGIFDSGIGGLIILRTIKQALPTYDYIYLGDTKRVPYGNRSQQAIFEFTCEAVDYLFKQGAGLVIVACNSASARALRKVQQDWLPKHYPKRRVLGVIVPTVEEVIDNKKIKSIGIIATQATVNSRTYDKEIYKRNRKIKVYSLATPLLVPLIENNDLKWARAILKDYLKFFKVHKIEVLLLGCTHYPIVKNIIRSLVTKKIKVISQDEIIPKKLKLYLRNHPEIAKILSHKAKVDILVTDMTSHIKVLAAKWFSKNAKLKVIKLD